MIAFILPQLIALFLVKRFLTGDLVISPLKILVTLLAIAFFCEN